MYREKRQRVSPLPRCFGFSKKILLIFQKIANLAHFEMRTNPKKDVAAAQITESHKNKLTGLKETKIVTSDVLHYRTVQKLIQVHYL